MKNYSIIYQYIRLSNNQFIRFSSIIKFAEKAHIAGEKKFTTDSSFYLCNEVEIGNHSFHLLHPRFVNINRVLLPCVTLFN